MLVALIRPLDPTRHSQNNSLYRVEVALHATTIENLTTTDAAFSRDFAIAVANYMTSIAGCTTGIADVIVFYDA